MTPFIALIGLGLLGALSALVTMLGLARLGLFEPLELDLFGKTYCFAPKSGLPATYLRNYPARQTAFAGVVTTVLTIAAPGVGVVGLQGATSSGSAGTTIIKEEI